MPTDVPSQFYQPFLHVTVFSAALNCPGPFLGARATGNPKSEGQPSASWKVWAPQLPKLSFLIIISSSVISHCDDTCKGNSRKLGT